jgi:glucose dehydrogenase
MHGGATIWNTPAIDLQLGLVYFAVGNCGPDYDRSMRAWDNLFCASIVALKAKTGEYAWHFKEVHYDIWDYDGRARSSSSTQRSMVSRARGSAGPAALAWSTFSTIPTASR